MAATAHMRRKRKKRAEQREEELAGTRDNRDEVHSATPPIPAAKEQKRKKVTQREELAMSPTSLEEEELHSATPSIPAATEQKRARWILIQSQLDIDDLREVLDYAWTQANLSSGRVYWAGTNWVVNRRKDDSVAWTIIYGRNPIPMENFRRFYLQDSRADDIIRPIPRRDLQMKIHNLFLLRTTLITSGKAEGVPYIQNLDV